MLYRSMGLLTGETGIMKFSAVHPQGDCDVIRIGVRTDEAQIDRFCACLIEYDIAVVNGVNGSRVTDRKIPG